MPGRCHRPTSPRKRFSGVRPPARRARLLGALLLAALPLAALLVGCSSQSELTRIDPSVTETELRQGKVAVLGVVKFQEPDQVRPPLVAMLERTFRDERKDLTLISADSVRQMLGAERDRRLLLAYEYQGALDPAALAEISDSLRGAARFLLCARVDRDRTRNSTREITPADTGTARPDWTMGITGRDARVAVHLYDLSSRKLAVSATLEGSSENSQPMLSPFRRRGASGVTLEVGQAVPPEQQGYPGVPELAPALEEPFRTFARMLPGAPRPPGTPPPAGRR